MTAADTTTRTDVDVDLNTEVPCEARHLDSECTGRVTWSAAPFPCGCVPRRNVCDGYHDRCFSHNRASLTSACGHCRLSFAGSEWLAGWRRL